MSKVRVTPLKDTLVENGVRLVHSYDESCLRKLDWPATPGRRAPEGGNGGDFMPEPMKLEWHDDNLIFPLIGGVDVPIAKRHGNLITYSGSMIAQMDADVAYFPEKHIVNLHSKEFIIFVCSESTATGEKMFRALHIPHGHGVIVDAFVAHSVPIPLKDNSVEFKAYHRSCNSVRQYRVVEPVTVDLTEVDESTTLNILKLVDLDEEATESAPVKLPLDFSSEVLKIHPATQQSFCSYGLLVEDHHEYKEEVNHVAWPCTTKLLNFPGLDLMPYGDELNDCRGGSLTQDFKMTWVTDLTDGHTKAIRFNGKTGSFAGAEGKPGVEFNALTGEFKVNTLMTRPDGSFYLHALGKKTHFLMVFAKPDKTTGEPLKESLAVFSFGIGQGVRLGPGVWHSVPILMATEESAEFREIISETNANMIANVEFESNGPITFKL